MAIHGYQVFLAEFNDKVSHFPYYSMMYYGVIGMAVYGSLVVVMTVVCIVELQHGLSFRTIFQMWGKYNSSN